MFRKLTLLALTGAVIAWLLKQRSGEDLYETTPAAPAATETPASAEDTVETDAVVPDTSADDPLVREQEDAAAAEAAEVGGKAGAAPAEVEPELRPVVEGSGDAPEVLEALEDEGR